MEVLLSIKGNMDHYYACKQRLWSEVIYAYCSFPGMLGVTTCTWLALSYPHLSSPLSLSLLIFVEAEGDVSLSCEG